MEVSALVTMSAHVLMASAAQVQILNLLTVVRGMLKGPGCSELMYSVIFEALAVLDFGLTSSIVVTQFPLYDGQKGLDKLVQFRVHGCQIVYTNGMTLSGYLSLLA